MSFVLRDFVHETTTTEGDGSIELDQGAAGDDRVTFASVMADGDTTYVVEKSATNWQVAYVQFVSGSPNQLAILSVVRNKAGNTTAIDWGAGSKDVYMAIPATHSVVSLATGEIQPTSSIEMTSERYIEWSGGGETFRAFTNSDGNFALLDKSDDSLVLGDEDISGTRTLKTDRPFQAASVAATTMSLNGSAITSSATRGIAQIYTGTAQAGSSSTITLASDASGVTGAYVGARITLTGGTGSGQIRYVTAYNPTTKVATVNRDWATNPTSSTEYQFDTAPSEANKLPALDGLGFIKAGQIRTIVGATDVADGEGGMLPLFLSEERYYTIFGDGQKRPVIRRGSTQTIAAGAWALGQSLGPYSHGLTDVNAASARPNSYEIDLVCATGELGYSAGWVYPLGRGGLATGTNAGIQPIAISTTQYRLLIGTGNIPIIRADTRAAANLTPGSWNIQVTPYRWSWI